jgi:mono/diheme cytochrome c family protein
MSSLRVALAAACSLLAGCQGDRAPDAGVDPRNGEQVARGGQIYKQNCAVCHGEKLEGQPNWRIRMPNGRLPAPPHDDSGHTWHHPLGVLFNITKNGLVPPHAPKGYESDMPAFGSKLSDDDIRAVLAYIASHWSDEVWAARREMASQR